MLDRYTRIDYCEKTLCCDWPFEQYRKFLSFRTDRSGQTVQTQIRLLLRVNTVCYFIYIFWTHFSMVMPRCSNFKMITTIFSVSKFLGLLRYGFYCRVRHTKYEDRMANSANPDQTAPDLCLQSDQYLRCLLPR